MLRTALYAFAAMLAVNPAQAQEVAALSQRTMDALTHVVAHEIGHAFIREFDIPILGAEEGIADDFATVYVFLTFPERAEDIVVARAAQNLEDGQDMSPFSEYVDDDQRAGRALCLLYGLDPDSYADFPTRFNISEDDAAACRDFAPEIGRSWRRLIASYRLPDGTRVTEVNVRGDDIPLTETLSDSPFYDDIYTMLSAIDWHSLITVSLEACDAGTGWSRNARRIVICDGYVARFEAQLGQ